MKASTRRYPMSWEKKLGIAVCVGFAIVFALGQTYLWFSKPKQERLSCERDEIKKQIAFHLTSKDALADGLNLAYEGATVHLHREPFLTNADVDYVGRSFAQYGLPVFLLKFNEDGRKKLEEFSGAHINEIVAVVVDGKIESLPVISANIPGGEIELNLGASDSRGNDIKFFCGE